VTCSQTIPQRGGALTLDVCGIYLDYSRTAVTDETVRLLLRLADESGLRAAIDASFARREINITRTAPSCTWPSARRARADQRRRHQCRAAGTRCWVGWASSPTGPGAPVGGYHGQADPQHRQHRHRGSDLGPVMAYEALRHYSQP